MAYMARSVRPIQYGALLTYIMKLADDEIAIYSNQR